MSDTFNPIDDLIIVTAIIEGPTGITAVAYLALDTGATDTMISVGPLVAAGDDARGAVGLGEVVERPHGVDDDGRMRPGQGIDGLVAVEYLRLLAGAYLDADGRAQLVVPQDAVEYAEGERVHVDGATGFAERFRGRW